MPSGRGVGAGQDSRVLIARWCGSDRYHDLRLSPTAEREDHAAAQPHHAWIAARTGARDGDGITMQTTRRVHTHGRHIIRLDRVDLLHGSKGVVMAHPRHQGDRIAGATHCQASAHRRAVFAPTVASCPVQTFGSDLLEEEIDGVRVAVGKCGLGRVPRLAEAPEKCLITRCSRRQALRVPSRIHRVPARS